MESLQPLINQLDQWFEAEFTFLQSEPLAKGLLQLSKDERLLLLDTTRQVASTNIQLGYEICQRALRHWQQLTPSLLESWALHTMDTYDLYGLQRSMALLQDIDFFRTHLHEQTYGAHLHQQQGSIGHFLHALSGRRLKLAEDQWSWTDSETIYLPRVVTLFEDKKRNQQLFLARATFLWSQIQFATLMPSLLEHPLRNSPRFMAIFTSMERLRLERKIESELPGMYRTMQDLLVAQGEVELPHAWQVLEPLLSAEGCDLAEVLRLTERHLQQLEPLAPVCYQGELNLDRVASCRGERIEQERVLFKVKLTDMQQREQKGGEEREEVETQKAAKEGSTEQQQLIQELTTDQLSHNLPESLQSLAQSILLDFGEIPPEYLTAAGPGDYDVRDRMSREADPEKVWEGTYHEEGAYLYDEWDYSRNHYRKNWCAVREIPQPELQDDFVAQTKAKYRAELRQLHRTFEAMRDEDRLLKRQFNGDEVDIDALVDAQVDRLQGHELSEQLFTRMYRQDRNIGVLFMIDISGSTRGWINQAERESLILMCEALERVGDRYGIYAFSGYGRKRCEIYTLKEFSEPYGTTVQSRISGLQPKDYTRMGFAIRHLTAKLKELQVKTRILITLSDGRPDDYNDYHGEYGIQDTRMALVEARRSGIHPYCITIDESAQDYLPRLYGSAAYTQIDDVRQLPFKIGDIYRRLTR